MKITSKIRKFFSKDRIISLSMLGKILGLVIMLTFAPATLAKAESAAPEGFKSELRFDNKSVEVLSLPKQELCRFETVESEHDRIERENREKQEALRLASFTQSKQNRQVIARDYRPARTDPDLASKRALAKKAAAQYGIDWKILEAVWQVESGKAWDTSKSSYAGARGPMQFMPSTWKKYAVDGNGDGSADMYSAEDAVFGAANLLAQSGADRGDINSALLSYNHAQWYVTKVKGVANSIQE